MSTYAFLFTRPAQINPSFSLLFSPSSHPTLTSFFHISSWHHMPPLSLSPSSIAASLRLVCKSEVYLESYFMMYNAVASLMFRDWFFCSISTDGSHKYNFCLMQKSRNIKSVLYMVNQTVNHVDSLLDTIWSF